MKILSTETLIKQTQNVLEQPFWIPTLETNTNYSRTHDDHDGTFTGKINIFIDEMGDIFLILDKPQNFTNSLRFRTYGGGGNSLRVRNALMILAEAIRLDNLEKPEQKN